ncbi:MAG: hypothetical protein V2J19_00220 [Wenzhouxiangella sp.]|jgi:hypothetical protein|nr:hypothetical protein [Wenzhouxiangella sp.]
MNESIKEKWNRIGKGPQRLIVVVGMMILGLLLFHWGTVIGEAIYLATHD